MLLSLFLSTVFAAPPTDAELIRQIKKKDVISVKVSDQEGRRSLTGEVYAPHSVNIENMWQKNVVLVRPAHIAEFPDATVEIGGVMQYDVKGDTYTYRGFKVTWNDYKGIPAPSNAEILSLVKTDLPTLVGETRYNNEIVSEISDLKLMPGAWEWHNANSVSLNVTATYDWREGVYEPTTIETQRHFYRLRLYRESPQQPFNRFISSPISTMPMEVIGKTSLPTSTILAMVPLGQGGPGAKQGNSGTKSAGSASSSGPLKFHTFEWPEARIRAKLPEGKREKTNDTIFDNYPTYTVRITLPNSTQVEINSIVYPKALTKAQATKFVEDFSKLQYEALGATFKGGSDWNIGTYGRHLSLSHPSHEIHFSTVVVQDVYYSVTISAPKGQLDPKIRKTVLETFRPWM